MERGKKLYEKLKNLSYDLGAALFGVADVKAIKKEFHFLDEILKDLDYAISIGVRLSDSILEEIKNTPTKIYYHHYRQANIELDKIAFRLSNFIQSEGYNAIPVSVSQVIDWEKQIGHLSHKKIGELAGLGFMGRNNLLVNPEFGSRFRLVTILTNTPLKPDKPIKENCASCRACIEVCPSGAIKEEQKDFDHIKCYKKLKNFKDKKVVDQFICGICVKACRGKICKKIQ